MRKLSLLSPNLTARQIRAVRFPVNTATRPAVLAKEARLAEIVALIKAGYSKRSSIALELKTEVSDALLGKHLSELRKQGAIQLVAKEFWVPK